MIHRKTKRHNVVKSSRRFFNLASPGQTGGGGSRRNSHGQIFAAGSIVRESGIYEVIHDGGHRSSHDVVMISEDLFPTCDVCEARVRYRVVRTAPYIFSDEDFEESKD